MLVGVMAYVYTPSEPKNGIWISMVVLSIDPKFNMEQENIYTFEAKFGFFPKVIFA
jgi:hypothetical protein